MLPVQMKQIRYADPRAGGRPAGLAGDGVLTVDILPTGSGTRHADRGGSW